MRGASKEPKRGAARSAREALADTWFDRARNLIERIRDEASEEELRDALAQPTSVSGVSVLLGGAAAAAADFDAYAPALLEGARQKELLLEEAGGGLTRTQVAELLDIMPPAVDQRRRRGQLLFVETLGRRYLYPACQFTGEGTLPHLAEALGWMRVEEGWMRLDMLLSPLRPLGGRTPVEALRSGATDAELAELRSVFETWGV